MSQNYSVLGQTLDNETLYKTEDNKRSCIGIDPVFQQWLRDNRDDLPDDIQAKVDNRSLVIQS
jgi:hypothetical protein